jgi:hypothetical protein
MNTNETPSRAQVIRCECGKRITAACVIPFNHTDADWHKSIRKAANQGRQIDEISCDEVRKGAWCYNDSCDKRPTLFQS